MTFHIVTLFPHAFDSYLGESILRRAIEDKKIAVKFYNPREFTPDKHLRIDRKPYGGGPGMVIQALPVIKAIEAAYSDVLKNTRIGGKKKPKAKSYKLKAPIIWLSPSGKQFANATGVKLAKNSDIIIICGRYEGIDARVKQAIRDMRMSARQRIGGSAYSMAEIKLEEMSVGPYVLTGGELPAMILLDVIARQVPGVLGDFNSREETRIASPDVYTRPEVIEYRGKKYKVPKILLSGHHAKIDQWRRAKSSRKMG